MVPSGAQRPLAGKINELTRCDLNCMPVVYPRIGNQFIKNVCVRLLCERVLAFDPLDGAGGRSIGSIDILGADRNPVLLFGKGEVAGRAIGC